MKKTPVALAKERFTSKEKLIDAVQKLATDDLWLDRVNKVKGLAKVSNAKLLRLLKDVPREKRTARFRCVIALTPVELETQNPKLETSSSPVCYADELEIVTEIFDGACEGRIEFAPRGQGGFGYDPLFIPNDFEQSFAELGEDVKNRLSHRSKALAKLKERLKKL